MTQIELWIDRIKMRLIPTQWVKDESARLNRQRLVIQSHPYNLEPTTRVRMKPRTWYANAPQRAHIKPDVNRSSHDILIALEDIRRIKSKIKSSDHALSPQEMAGALLVARQRLRSLQPPASPCTRKRIKKGRAR
jgi:hypothetical protein